MAQRSDDFDLVFERKGDEYVVQLISSPTGQASSTFSPPFTEGALRDFYQRLGQRHRTRRVESAEGSASKQFGSDLFNATFKGELLAQLRASSDRSRSARRTLRLRLRLRNVPELAELPWEFLYDPEQDHFLATSSMTPVIRYLDLAQGVSALRVRLPLKILVVICSPLNLPRLDTEGEWQRLKDALGDLEEGGVIALERQDLPTLDGLRMRARRSPFHILHFIGHGSFDMNARCGVLHFENETGMSDPVPGHILGNILRDHDSLRLAVLNACEGARQSIEDAFSGVAQSLCQQRLPATIAMQFEISDDAAKTFAYEFFKAIAECRPVEAAVALARQALFANRLGQEWATPVLYMRSADGVLFDARRKPASPSPSPKQPRRETRKATKPGLEETTSVSVIQPTDMLLSANACYDAQDYTQAKQWYEKAATAGSAAAMNNLGELYRQGLGVPSDYGQARQWYEKAAAAGNAIAMNNLGELYRLGLGVSKDYVLAKQWYEKAATAGGAAAMDNLGFLYENGLGVPKDYVQAKQWYEKSVAAGHANAMNNLGSLYVNGLGVPKDYVQAKQLYEKAATAGHTAAMNNLGELYRKGLGVSKDYVQAKQLYEKAANAGHAASMTDLAFLYHVGIGVPQDYAQARQWYEKAAGAGEAIAMNNLGQLYREGLGVSEDYAQAMQWYEKAAAAGNDSAMYNLGATYEQGSGVAKSRHQAKQWYEKAAAAGNESAKKKLESFMFRLFSS